MISFASLHTCRSYKCRCPVWLYRHHMDNPIHKVTTGLRRVMVNKRLMQYYQAWITFGHPSLIHTTKTCRHGHGSSAPCIHGTMDCSAASYLIVHYRGGGSRAWCHSGWRVTARELAWSRGRPGAMSSEHLEHGAQLLSPLHVYTKCLQDLTLGPKTCFVYVSSEVRMGAVTQNDGRIDRWLWAQTEGLGKMYTMQSSTGTITWLYCINRTNRCMAITTYTRWFCNLMCTKMESAGQLSTFTAQQQILQTYVHWLVSKYAIKLNTPPPAIRRDAVITMHLSVGCKPTIPQHHLR
jgi:hypothetical protein